MPTLTSHALARLLLDMPDVQAIVQARLGTAVIVATDFSELFFQGDCGHGSWNSAVIIEANYNLSQMLHPDHVALSNPIEEYKCQKLNATQ